MIASLQPGGDGSKSGQFDPKSVSVDEAAALAEEAFVFGLPLVYIAVQIETEHERGEARGAAGAAEPVRAFPELPDASDQVVVGLNVDTLYSLGSLDLSDGPLVLSVPEMGDRYWLMQLIDAWNNVPQTPGSRTVGGKGGDFAIVGPGWTGELPKGVSELRMPTNLGVIGGRTYVSGPEDIPAVHALQDQYRLVPLENGASDWEPPAEVPVKPGVDVKTPVPRQVLAMTPETFFGRLNALLPANPPYAADAPVMERIARLGDRCRARVPLGELRALTCSRRSLRESRLEAGGPRAGGASRRARQRLAGRARPRPLRNQVRLPGRLDVLRCRREPDRGRLLPARDHRWHGEPLDSAHRYTLHFDHDRLPPVNAFWSLTMYDAESYLVANAINRYTLGDRSGLTYDDDGSLTLYIQSEKPDASNEANWLPAPQRGPLQARAQALLTQARGCARELEAATDRES